MDRVRKNVIKVFKEVGFKIEIQTQLKIVYFLDMDFQGFPIGATIGGGQFGQNGQKLHEIDKISIFGSKQWGGMGGGQADFLGSGGDPPVPPVSPVSPLPH